MHAKKKEENSELNNTLSTCEEIVNSNYCKKDFFTLAFENDLFGNEHLQKQSLL